MKTHEEIKKGLECCMPKWVANHWKSCSSECPYITLSASCRGQLVYDTLAYIQQLEDHIREVTKLVPKWISVEERYPESDVPVLLNYKSGCTTTGYWYDGFCEWNDMGGERITRPDFWMPLPEAPKE